MPFELHWESRGVYRRYLGDVTIAERARSFELICGDPRFDALRYTITDYLQVRNYEITPTATEEIAAMHIGPLATNPRIVLAAVAVEQHIVEAIRHFIDLGFVKQPYRIFGDVAEARAWAESASGLQP